jgi:molecular chaperone GrpE
LEDDHFVKKKDKIEINISDEMEQEPQTSSGESVEDMAEPGEAMDASGAESTAEGESDRPLEALQAKLAEVKAEADEYLEGWQRARAEFANYKKRVENERETDRARLTGHILGRFIDIMDDFQRALKDLPTEGESATWSHGIEMIYRKFQAILESEGVEEIRPDGEQFDPNFHEAISQDESEDHKEGEIVEVIAPGFKIGDRVIRPAMVRIAK